MTPDPADDVTALGERLRTAPHGGVELDAIKGLSVFAEGGRREARSALLDHALHGRGVHRDYAAASLAELAGTVRRKGGPVPVPDPEWVAVFDRLMGDPATRYWAIPGLVGTAGPSAYGRLVALANDPHSPLAHRAQAVKCLAQASGQQFDRNLPADPGCWKEQDLRLDELNAWEVSGCPRGPGYPFPPRHPALDAPVTRLERLAARLDGKCAALREERYWPEDPACPCLRLVPASKSDMEAVAARWRLPAFYREFLERFSPLGVCIETEAFYNGGLCLYGARDLLNRQVGYAWYPNPTRPLPSWAPSHLVIADHAGDPFVLDLGRASATDAPILTAEHGTGHWAFEIVAGSFEGFLTDLLESIGA